MATNSVLLVKGAKRLGLTVLLMFTAPVIIYEAFKNQGHPLYYPVLIFGIVLALGAIVSGFTGIKLLVDAIFNKKSSSK